MSAIVGIHSHHRRAWRIELEEARRAISEGRYGWARVRLARLAENWTNQGEVLFLIGNCELARGRREEAVQAWSRVPRESPFLARAAVLQASHLINSGRYSAAEDLLLQAIAATALTEHQDLERTLSRVYRFEGRFDDVRQVLRRTWCRSPDPAGVLQELWLLDHSPMPAESWRAALEKANGEDDRVWLGRARLSLLTGQFPQAARWLSQCEKRRPDDPAVWQANLDLALATDDVTRLWKAAAHQPAGRVAAPDFHAIRAWLAERQGNRQAQRRELELLVRDRPGNTRAVESLAALMLDAGQPHEAERLHRLKSQGDAAKDRIRKILLDESQMLPHAAELARLSLTLSRDFDAAAWSLLEQAKAASAGEARICFDGSIPVPEALLVSARELSASSAMPTIPHPGVRKPWRIASPNSTSIRPRDQNVPRA